MPPLTSGSRSRTSAAVASEMRVAGSSGSARQPSTSVRKITLKAPSACGDGRRRGVRVDVVGAARRGRRRPTPRPGCSPRRCAAARWRRPARSAPTKPMSVSPAASCLPTVNRQAVVAAQPDRRLAVAVDAQHDVLVLLADQDHLGHLDGGLVRHAQAVDELDLHPEPLHVAGDVRPAAVHHDRVDPDVLEQHHVAGELLLELRVGHRRAAVLDHHRLAVELADVRQRLEQGGDVPHDVYSALKRA